MISSGQVTVTTSPTVIFGPDPDGAFLVIQVLSDGNVNVYLGNASVTTSNGFPVDKNDNLFTIQIGPDEKLYGVVSSSQATISYLATMS